MEKSRRPGADGLIHTAVMPGLVAGIHVLFPQRAPEDVDGRDKPGHGEGICR